MIVKALIVFAGGGLGSVLRWATSVATVHFFPVQKLPLGTLLSNVLSCLIFAVALSAVARIRDDQSLQLLFLTGICGGYSTFSTFSYETWLLIKNQMTGWAVLNVLINVLLCLLIFAVLMRKTV